MSQGQGRPCFETLDARMASIYRDLAAFAGARGPIFIHGSAGTGKGVACRLIRESGGYAANPLQEINCAALEPSRQEGALFGSSDEAGRAALAGDGLLIVEEIGEMSRSLQERLAFAIRTGRFLPAGQGEAQGFFRARLIATSSSPWNSLRNDGKLVPCLAALFEGRVVGLPALSERKRDIPLLIDYFISSLGDSSAPKKISPEVYHFLCAREWEGNVRELKNFVTRLYYLSGETITVRDLDEVGAPRRRQQAFAGTADVATLKPMSLYELEKKYILHMITVNGGNKSRTARALEISLKTLRNKLKEYAAAESQVVRAVAI